MSEDYIGPDEIEEGPSFKEIIDGIISIGLFILVVVVLRNAFRTIFRK